MAEENAPKFEINVQHKKIDNPRETFLAENENLIIGKKGLTFQYYPTKKQKLKHYLKNKFNNPFYKTFYNNKNILNNSNNNNSSRNIIHNESISKNSFKNSFINNNINNIKTLPKSFSQTNFFKNPTKIMNNYRKLYKEKLFNNILDFNENKLNNIDNNFQSNNSSKKIKSNLIFDKNIINESTNTIFNKTNSHSTKNNNKNVKIFSPMSKFQKIKYPKINSNKKKKEKTNLKTHFKGLESIYIKPKEIYDLFKKEDALRLEKLGYFNINEKKEKEQELIEKRNEYKSDIRELIKEEQNIQKIVNTKEFSELLGNNKYYKEAEYNDKSILNDWDEESKINYFSENEEEKNKKMNYLRKIAFEEKKVEKPRYQYQKVIPNNFIKKKKDTNKDEVDSEDDSFFEEMKRSKKKDNINILLEMEDQLRVEGKVYHMKNQMDKICKELLNKYKIHNVLKK